MKTNQLPELTIRIVIALLFLYAGVSKLFNPAAFAEAIDNYRMLPWFIVSLMAITLPWLEVLAGVGLFVARFRAASALLIFLLTTMFFIALFSAVIRGLDINCGCFVAPGESNSIGVSRLMLEAALWAGTLYLYITHIKETGQPSQ